MKINLVESMNDVFKGIKNLPITVLVRATYFKLGSLSATRGKKWHSILQSGQLFSESYMKVMKEETLKASTHGISIFDRHIHSFSVKETHDHNEGRPNGDYRVQLNRGWCSYGKFQAFCMPCSHVIVACSYARQHAFMHLSDVYKVVNIFNVYNNNFPVVALEDYCHA